MEISTTALRYERAVPLAVEQAFAVLTTEMDAWWPREYRLTDRERTGIEVEPRVGGTWSEVNAEGSCSWGQVLAWEPPHRVSFGWQITPAFAPEPDPARASRVDVELVPEGPTACRLVLVHGELDRHGEGWEQMRAGVDHDAGGWPHILDRFVEVAAERAGRRSGA